MCILLVFEKFVLIFINLDELSFLVLFFFSTHFSHLVIHDILNLHSTIFDLISCVFKAIFNCDDVLLILLHVRQNKFVV